MFDKATQTNLLDEAIASAKGGDRIKAKDKLTRYLRYDQKNEHAWLWMSSVVESDRERIFCLTNVLKLNPNNKSAKRGLALLGALPPEMRGDLDIEVIGVDLKADANRDARGGSATARRGGFAIRRNRRVENIAIALLAVVIVIGFILFGLNIAGSRLAAASLLGIKTPTYTASPSPLPAATETAAPTETPVPPTATDVAPDVPVVGANGTPIADFLGLPHYTPTPLGFKIPFFPEEAFGRGQKAYSDGDLDGAITSFKDAISQNKEDYVAHYYLGLIYLQKKNYNPAFNEFGSALKINSGFAPAYLGRGQATFGLGGNPLADYQKAKDASPNLVDPYIQAAAFYASRRNSDAAITELETARAIAPANVVVAWSLAEQYWLAGRMADAKTSLQTGFTVDGTAIDLYRVQAEILLSDGNFADALSNSNIYISYQPADPEGWILQGQAYVGLGQNDKALAALTKAVELKPDDPRDALIARGTAELKLGNPDAARKDFDQALALGITTRNRLLIGMAYYNSGDFETAVIEFNKSVGADQTLFETNYWLGASQVAAGQFKDSLKALNAALSKANSDLKRFDAFYTRAQAYHGLEQNDNAVSDLRDALVLNVEGRDDERKAAELLLSSLNGQKVSATQTPTPHP
jgi:tetratricopeptide (TPR) repeat protein